MWPATSRLARSYADSSSGQRLVRQIAAVRQGSQRREGSASSAGNPAGDASRCRLTLVVMRRPRVDNLERAIQSLRASSVRRRASGGEECQTIPPACRPDHVPSRALLRPELHARIMVFIPCFPDRSLLVAARNVRVAVSWHAAIYVHCPRPDAMLVVGTTTVWSPRGSEKIISGDLCSPVPVLAMVTGSCFLSSGLRSVRATQRR